jgi:hypothetical protein
MAWSVSYDAEFILMTSPEISVTHQFVSMKSAVAPSEPTNKPKVLAKAGQNLLARRAALPMINARVSAG